MSYKNYHYIDLRYISSLADGDVSFMMEMIRLFLEQSHLEIEKMDQAISTVNWVDVRLTAHKMRSSVNHVGAKSMLPFLEAIEKSALNLENIELIGFQFDEVKKICRLAVSELENELKYLKTLS